MHVYFEDDGQLKAGTVLADNDTSLQVEAASGKRLKIKAAAVLLRFTDPSPAALNADAQRLAGELDPNFLWEVSSDDEFGFADLAHEYYGRAPAAPEAAAVALALAGAPMYFYKRGKGRYRKAPPDALKAALASVERKKREAAEVAAWRDDLAANRLPDALRAKLPMLLHKPDKTSLEWKALMAACDAQQTNPLALLSRCGAIPSTHEYHFDAFLAQAFPQGTTFPPWGELPAPPPLPVAAVRAFSIDDATTTEIDDAFSVRELASGNCEIGIHIAAPAIAIPRGTPLDAIARTRLSTVYMPGRKITMLPGEVVAAFTLGAGRAMPALSLYAEVRQDGTLVRHETRVESVPIAANLSLDTLGEAFANELPSPADPEWTPELRALWKFAQALFAARGKADFARDRLQLRRRLGRGAGRPRDHPAAAAGQPARQARVRAHDLRQQHLGKAARRCARGGTLPNAGQRQGEDEHPTGRAPGAGAFALPLGELAAAPVQRPRQPAAAHRRAGRSEAAVRRQRRRALRDSRGLRGNVFGLRRVPGPDGALLVPALAAAGRDRGDDRVGDPREPRPLRPPSARRPPRRPASRSNRARRCASRSAASTCLPRRSSAATPARRNNRPGSKAPPIDPSYNTTLT